MRRALKAVCERNASCVLSEEFGGSCSYTGNVVDDRELIASGGDVLGWKIKAEIKMFCCRQRAKTIGTAATCQAFRFRSL